MWNSAESHQLIINTIGTIYRKVLKLRTPLLTRIRGVAKRGGLKFGFSQRPFCFVQIGRSTQQPCHVTHKAVNRPLAYCWEAEGPSPKLLLLPLERPVKVGNFVRREGPQLAPAALRSSGASLAARCRSQNARSFSMSMSFGLRPGVPSRLRIGFDLFSSSSAFHHSRSCFGVRPCFLAMALRLRSGWFRIISTTIRLLVPASHERLDEGEVDWRARCSGRTGLPGLGGFPLDLIRFTGLALPTVHVTIELSVKIQGTSAPGLVSVCAEALPAAVIVAVIGFVAAAGATICTKMSRKSGFEVKSQQVRFTSSWPCMLTSWPFCSSYRITVPESAIIRGSWMDSLALPKYAWMRVIKQRFRVSERHSGNNTVAPD